MRAAIYARKSTEQERGDTGDSLSVGEQVTGATAFILKQGWTLGPIFKDEATSGWTIPLQDRDGGRALMAAIKARSFDVLVIRNETRLGREMSDNLVAQVAIDRAGIKLYGYSDGQEIKAGKAIDKMMACLRNFSGEQESETKSLDARRGKLATARAGKFPGGIAPYGYTRQGDGLVPNDDAQNVRRIFDLAASKGLLKIAQTVGRQTTSVRNALYNRVYLGTWVYKGRAADGTPETVTIPVPPIITQAQWDAAHKRMDATRAKHPGYSGVLRDANSGKLQGRVATDTGLDSRHLLSGFIRCGCGSSMHLSCIGHKGGRVQMGYLCTRRYKQGGPKLDGCKGSVPYDAITQAVRGALDRETVEREVMAYLEAIKLPTEDSGRERIAADLAKAEKEEQNWLAAIGQGGNMPTLVARLKAASAHVMSLRTTLESHQAVADHLDEINPQDIADELRLAQEGKATGYDMLPDVTADRKVLRALGVQITVDQALKEAIIVGDVARVVAGRLSPNVADSKEVGIP